ncbi:MAG: DUF929 domain-containing protein [Thermoplasmata archaeon]|nr:DUF929 domain-containing protein [Thermoplasmata archaeon]
MVDWDQVERLRGKGWDWSRIADDERVGFTAEATGGDSGRQLRTLYYQRRSKVQRRTAEGKSSKDSDSGPDSTKPPALLRFGYLAVPLFGIWAVIAFLFPSPSGVYLPGLDLAIVTIIVVLVLLFALFRAPVKWETALRRPIVIGVVLGFVAAGTVTLVALSQGCPTLTTTSASGEPNNWDRYNNPSWTENGAPVMFFYGSIACPYCSASSWAMAGALRAFGTLSGTTLGYSNPGDVYPKTPEVELNSAQETSPYVALKSYEGSDPTTISTPTLGSCQLQAYVTTYDSGGTIPFLVLGGTYVHAGLSLINPHDLINTSSNQPYTPQEVQDQVDAGNGPAWTVISSAQYTIEAILLKLNGGQGPPGVMSDPNVQAQLTQLH